MSRRRRRRPKPPPESLTLSATDAEWAVVRANAAWRGVSISRYVVALVLDGGGDAPDGPALALAGDEKREMLETVRSFRTLMGDGAEAPPLIEDMRVRVRLLFDAWAVGMVRDGRRGELRDILAARVGAAQAERVVENIVALADAPAQPRAPEPKKRTGPDESPGQESLF